MLNRELNGECQGGKNLRQRQVERNKCKGPGAGVSPPVNQEKTPLLLSKQSMPRLRTWEPDHGLLLRPPCPPRQVIVVQRSHTEPLPLVHAWDLEEQQEGWSGWRGERVS